MAVPYASATSGAKARDEITKLLQRFGCESVGFMDDFASHSVLLAFRHRGRDIQLRASAKGWAQMYLKENPWNSRRRETCFEAVFVPHMLTHDGKTVIERIAESNLLPPPEGGR